jgi:hypothetical protein
MFPCPHCQQPIEVLPRPKAPWYRYDPGDPKVGLGCGSLFLIAIIVWLCSGGFGTRDELRDLRSDVQRLAKKVDEVAVAVKPAAPNAAEAP